MDPEYLDFEEVELECLVRDIEGSLGQKLSQLKERIELEAKYPSLVPNKAHEGARKNPKIEINKIVNKFQVIVELFNEVLKSNNFNELSQLQSKLTHLYGRLHRLKYSKVVAEEVNETLIKCGQFLEIIKTSIINNKVLDESMDQFKALKLSNEVANDGDSVNDSFETVSQTSFFNFNRDDLESSKFVIQNHSNLDNHLNSYNNTSKFVNQNEHVKILNYVDKFDSDIPQNQDNFQIPNSKQHLAHSHSDLKLFRILPSKWNISFDGSPLSVPAKRFIFKVEYLAKSNSISDIQLVRDFNYLLKGLASDWYWTFVERNQSISWTILKEEFIKRFQDRRTDMDIRREMDNRKQKLGEGFVAFYNEMLSISLQLEYPISDSELMYFLRQNMRAGLQDKITNINFSSIDELVRSCMAYEDTWKRTGYSPELLCQQPRKYMNEIEYRSSINIGQEEVSALHSNRPVNNLPIPSSSSPGGKFPFKTNCWNCNRSDHIFKECTYPVTRKFCFGCGYNGVLKPQCFRCRSKLSENPQRGMDSSNFIPRILTKSEEVACNTDPELQARQQFNHK